MKESGLIPVGAKFGNQSVIGITKKKYYKTFYRVKCGCGNVRLLQKFSLKSVKSCIKCSRRNTIHGYSSKSGKEHYLYRAWKNMRTRCYDKNFHHYKDYGGRGIKVYTTWNSFINFKNYIEKYLGERPKGYSLDRIINSGDYEPGNIRWASPKQQNRNQRGREGK